MNFKKMAVEKVPFAPEIGHMKKPTNNTGLRRILNAFNFSYRGFMAAFKNEEAFRQEVFIAVVLLPVAIFISKNKWEFIALVSSVVFVLIVELLNSAVEAVVDRVGMEYNELSGRAKDMGSAAVLLSGVIWAVTWGAIVFF